MSRPLPVLGPLVASKLLTPITVNSSAQSCMFLEVAYHCVALSLHSELDVKQICANIYLQIKGSLCFTHC